VVAVKQANNEDLGPIEGLEILAGNDEVFLRTLELGGAGGILVASHIVGREMRALYEAQVSGDGSRARELDAGLEPIYRALTVTSNPTPVKTALEMLGMIEGHLRLPMVPASDRERDAIRGALEQHGLLVAGGAR
jgi:4-hydroxy-tetrahydrodipicolinate synthase